MKSFRLAVAAVTALLAVSGAAQATIVMQTIPNMDMRPTGTYFSGKAMGGEIGEEVDLSKAANIDSATFALSAEVALPQDLTVTLYKNAPALYGANQLGAIAYQQTFTSSSEKVVNTHNDSYLVTVAPVGMDIKANAQYDLVISSANNIPALLATYNSSAGGKLDSFSVNMAWGGWFGGTNGQDLGVVLDPIGVAGSPGVSAGVPEPSSWALMALGFCGIMALSNRARRNRLSLQQA